MKATELVATWASAGAMRLRDRNRSQQNATPAAVVAITVPAIPAAEELPEASAAIVTVVVAEAGLCAEAS